MRGVMQAREYSNRFHLATSVKLRVCEKTTEEAL